MTEIFKAGTYKVEGMTCGGCVGSVQRALSAALPAARVEVSLAEGEVRIEGEHDPRLVKSTIEDAGFDLAQT